MVDSITVSWMMCAKAQRKDFPWDLCDLRKDIMLPRIDRHQDILSACRQGCAMLILEGL